MPLTLSPSATRTGAQIARDVLALVGASASVRRSVTLSRVRAAQLDSDTGTVALITERENVTERERSALILGTTVTAQLWERDAATGAYVALPTITSRRTLDAPIIRENYAPGGYSVPCRECRCVPSRAGLCECDGDAISPETWNTLRVLADARREMARTR